ncbi:MAG: capsular polysaccharide transport system permease protein [Rhodobacteraceae bacterium HLUCCA08]|nr:MAG: capsular polysaccharide transport system permease protein [Rhodobacteraceae bacterium HLUCCA08]
MDKSDAEQRQDTTREDPASADKAPRNGERGGKRNGPRARKRPDPEVVEVAPIAGAARMRRRHWGVLFSFLLMVLAPLAVSVWYLWWVATDQYASTVGFTVRQEDSSPATAFLGGVAAELGGGGTQTDTDVLFEFIQSQDMVARLNARFDLVGHYARYWDQDPVLALWPDATIEDLVWYWGRIVRTSYDQSSGLIELRVLAFDPDFAQTLASAIVEESQDLINDMNAQARADMISYAQEDLDTALDRLKLAREALTLFRTRTQIVDPESDLQGRLGVVNNLQQQLAQALIEQDLLLEQSTSENNPRLEQAARRIDVIRNRIAQEREAVSSGDGEDYPTLLAEYEGLVVDREFAEESYRVALTALDVARNNATRQNRYLATYLAPTRPETAEFPRRFMVLGLATLFLMLAWSILVMIYYSVRDSR